SAFRLVHRRLRLTIRRRRRRSAARPDPRRPAGLQRSASTAPRRETLHPVQKASLPSRVSTPPAPDFFASFVSHLRPRPTRPPSGPRTNPTSLRPVRGLALSRGSVGRVFDCHLVAEAAHCDDGRR